MDAAGLVSTDAGGAAGMALTQLLAANIAFVGSHFALSHPLRGPLVGKLGERGFLGVYSLVAFAFIAWVAMAFKAAPPGDLGGSGAPGWALATLLTLPALVLFAGSMAGNPALPAPDANAAAGREPAGVFLVTRHPMMWGFALWALSHIALWWSTRTLITATAMLVLALLGAHLQDRKKRALMGEAWRGWEARTSYWPRWGQLFRVGWKWWLAGGLLWLLAQVAHRWAAGIDAGILRWV